MKTIKICLKPISLFMAFLILLQGCVIYKEKPVSLDDAVIANTRVRIETTDNQTLKYKRIEAKNGQYYGIKKSNKAAARTPIDAELVENVKIKDKTMSTIVTIAIPIMFLVFVASSKGRGSCGF